MSYSHRITRGFGVLGASLLAACATDSVTSPVADEVTAVASAPSFSLTNGLACQTITFNEGGLAHGGQVTSIGLSGMTIGFSVVPYVPDVGYPGATPPGILRAFDTNNQTHPEDTDLMVLPAGNCAMCLGQDNVLIIEHERGFASDGDYRWGGAITLTGIPAGHYIRSYKAFDNENQSEFPPPEAPIRLFVGGEQIGASTLVGNATVELVTTTKIKNVTGSVVFTLGTEAQDAYGGSGAIDDIVICPLPDEGCTPGYWKNHLGAWAATGYSPNQTLESVFDVPDAYGLDDVTLLAALSLGGGSGTTAAAGMLLHHAVAALLNASNPDVDYPRTTAQIIADVNAALATNSRSTMLTLKSALDADNNLGCPLN